MAPQAGRGAQKRSPGWVRPRGFTSGRSTAITRRGPSCRRVPNAALGRISEQISYLIASRRGPDPHPDCNAHRGNQLGGTGAGGEREDIQPLLHIPHRIRNSLVQRSEIPPPVERQRFAQKLLVQRVGANDGVAGDPAGLCAGPRRSCTAGVPHRRAAWLRRRTRAPRRPRCCGPSRRRWGCRRSRPWDRAWDRGRGRR